MLQESEIKLNWFQRAGSFFQIFYLILRYGVDGTEKKLNDELEELRKETSLLHKLRRKIINEKKGGKMCKRPIR